MKRQRKLRIRATWGQHKTLEWSRATKETTSVEMVEHTSGMYTTTSDMTTPRIIQFLQTGTCSQR